MSIGTGAAIALGVGSAAAGIGSSLIGSSASKSAAQSQQQAADAATAEQRRQFDITQANYAPWLAAGQGGLAALTQGTTGDGSLLAPYSGTYQTPAPFSQAGYTAPAPFSYGTFTAPTGVDESNDPGYAFRLQQGNQAIQRAAAAGGGAFSGGTLKALTQYGQDYASNEYQNVYNRALQGYQTNFQNALNSYGLNAQTGLNAYNTNAAALLNAYNTNVNTGLNAFNTQYNTYAQNQANQFNRLAALSGLGQSAAGSLAQAGQASASNIANLLTGAGNAQAAGTLGSAAAWNQGLGSITGGVQGIYSNLQNAQLLKMLTGGSGGGSGTTPYWDTFGVG
jgi:hypothetical protein